MAGPAVPFAVIEGVEREYVTNLHRHNFDEALYVVEGALTVHVSGQTRRVPAGSYVFIPRGVPHAQGNREKTPVKNILTVTPAGFENSFRDRVDRFAKAKPGTPEWDRLTAEMQKRARSGGYLVERRSDSSPIQ
jgi:gentisate 1,2-dioxygenase